MIAELDKEKEENVQAETTFAQNLKSQIAEHEETLDKLLDLQLSGTISTEEYAAKKQKILNKKIEISEKLKDFEQKGNRWLELCKNFVLTANQAQIAALQGDFSEKKNFLKKIGSFGNCLKIRPPKRGAKPRARRETQTLQIGCVY